MPCPACKDTGIVTPLRSVWTRERGRLVEGEAPDAPVVCHRCGGRSAPVREPEPETTPETDLLLTGII